MVTNEGQRQFDREYSVSGEMRTLTPEQAGLHPPPPIRGYRALSQEEVDLVNRSKAKGIEVEDLIEEIKTRGGDARWIAIATTQLQQGFMALARAITKPEGF